jgi:hypothetical protein
LQDDAEQTGNDVVLRDALGIVALMDGRCHVNFRWPQPGRRGRFSGGGCDGFPLRHRTQAMQAGG